MIEDPKTVARNIRSLRKIFDETEEALGDAICVGVKTIQKYESGKALVPEHRRRDIAAHYGVAFEQLNDPEFLSWLGDDENQLAAESIAKISQSTLPVLRPSGHFENEEFEAAFSLHRRLRLAAMEILRLGEEDGGAESIRKCRELYEGLIRDEDGDCTSSVEACSVANLISLDFCEYTLRIQLVCPELAVSSTESVSLKDALVCNLKINASEGARTLRGELRERDFERLYEIGLLRRFEMKGKSLDYADFFFALRYIVGLADETFALETDQPSIGFALMAQFALMGNLVCAKYLNQLRGVVDSEDDFDWGCLDYPDWTH